MIASTTCEAKCFISLKKKIEKKVCMDQSILFRRKLICLLRWNFTRFHFIYQNFLDSYFWSLSDFRLIKIICRRGLPSPKCRYIIFVVNKHPLMVLYQPLVAEFNLFFPLNLTSIMTQVYLWSFPIKFDDGRWLFSKCFAIMHIAYKVSKDEKDAVVHIDF